MKHINTVFAIIISSVLVLFSALFIILPKESFSENENRILAAAPEFTLNSIASGKFTADTESYLADHFPFRNVFTATKTFFLRLCGRQDIGGVYMCGEHLIEKYSKPENTERFAEKINLLCQNIERDLGATLMLFPTNAEVNSELLPAYVEKVSQKDILDDYYKLTDCEKVDLLSPLKNESANYELYYRTDHHITSYGAFVGYREYCMQKDFTIPSLSDYDIECITDDFRGSLYSKVLYFPHESDRIHLFKYDYDVSVFYENENRYESSPYDLSQLSNKDKYLVFLGGNHPIIKITNKNAETDRKLILIKDSYANTVIPFLMKNFSEITVIDPRYYKDSISEYVNEHTEITDMLFIFNLGTLDSNTGINNLR